MDSLVDRIIALKRVWLSLAVLFIVGGSAYILRSYWKDQKELAAAQAFYEYGLSLPSQPSAPSGTTLSRGTFETLKPLLEKNRGTQAAFQAAFEWSSTQFVEHHWQQAALGFQEAASTAPVGYLKALGLLRAGISFENDHQIDQAVQVLKEASQLKESALQPEILLAWGRIEESRGQKAAAKDLYKRVLEEFGNTSYATTARDRKDALGSL